MVAEFRYHGDMTLVIVKESKKTDAFHIQIGHKLIARIRQFRCVQPTGRGYCCAKEEFHSNFYILLTFAHYNVF